MGSTELTKNDIFPNNFFKSNLPNFCWDFPSEWLQIGESCYLYSNDTKMTWFEAKEFCWNQGGFLAEIKSMEEEEPLDKELVHGVYWIGLNDFYNEGKYVWDGSRDEAEYINWKSGEPTRAGGEDCVFKSLESGSRGPGWLDYHCDWDGVWGIELQALCEYY